MAAVSGQGTTFNLPNYLGSLYRLNPAETPLYAMIGGRWRPTASKDFEWNTVDNDTSGSQDDVALEGADPTPTERSRAAGSNVLQIVQESFEVTYTKMAATGQLAGLAILGGDQEVTDERAFQSSLKQDKIKNDLEWSFLHGVYAKPADNATVRKTRGVVTAITTNAIVASSSIAGTHTVEADDDTFTRVAHGLQVDDEVVLAAITGGTGLTVGTKYFVISVPTADTYKVSTTPRGTSVAVTVDGSAITMTKRAQLTRGHFNSLLRTMVGNQARMSDLVMVVNSYNKQRITELFGYAPESRNVGGMAINQIETDFAQLGIVFDRHIDADTVALLNVGVMRPRVLPIPGKGFLFEEMLAKTGSAEQYQIYGEIGLEYGPEQWHGKITGLTTDAPAV